MRRLLLLGLLLSAAAAVGCSDNHNPVAGGTGTVRVRMTDAPASIDAVNLVVTEVSVHSASGSDEGGWQTISSESTTVDLMTLQNGVFITLAEGRVPAGGFDQVRLKLGAGSTVVVDGVEHPLVVPSGMQSGFKIIGTFSVPSGGTTDVGLDFDAERSVHETGNGTWMLDPVVRMVLLGSSGNSGAISGRVLPDTVESVVWAIMGTDTVSHTDPGSDGRFTLAALPVGTYNVTIDAETGWRDTTIANVTVNANQTTDIGDVQLQMPAAAPARLSRR